MPKWTSSNFKDAIDNAGIAKVKWWPGWGNTWHGMNKWAGPGGKPVALMLHHTAGASTSSKDPAAAGNQCDADNGQAKFVNRHPEFNSPASQFTLRRCGMLDVNAYLPCYHAGKGTFAGTEWKGHGIPTDAANRWLMGIEIVSKGSKDDITDAQWETLGRLARALAPLAGWDDTSTYHLPRHKDWAPTRKVDIKASNDKVQTMIGGHWDGTVPNYDGVIAAQNQDLANPQAWRLACRLADLGYYNGTPAEKYTQKYPAKAMIKYNNQYAPKMSDPTQYGPKAHNRIFGL